jgi:tRNA A37 methylthiotransferase MiaB
MFLGDCSGGYGLDIGSNFGELLKRVLDLEGNFSLTLTDIAPFYLPQCFPEIKELCSRNILPSLYIATQSANPRILTLMRRSFDMIEAKRMLLEIKAINPNIVLITSIIVGFPSETLEELEDTIVFCEEVGFNTVYCHGYSARPNVDSVKLQGQLSLQEIKKRCNLVKERLRDMVSLITIPGQGAEF